MGCSSSKQALIQPDLDIEVVPGQQARQIEKIHLKAGKWTEKAKGVKKGRKSAIWAMNGSQKEYLIFSNINDMSRTGHRGQYIANGNDTRTYCQFERPYDLRLATHRYKCKSADGSGNLFTTYRAGKKDLMVEINARSLGGRSQTGGGPVWILKCTDGVVTLNDGSRRPALCATIKGEHIKVMPGMDKLICVALALILKDIKEIDLLAKLGKHATPAPAKGVVGLAGGMAVDHAFNAPSRGHSGGPDVQGYARGVGGDVARDVANGYVTGNKTSISDSAYHSLSSRNPSQERGGRDESRGRSRSRRR